MPISIVQQAHLGTGFGTGPFNVTLSPVASGNTIVVMAAGSPSSITHNGSGTPAGTLDHQPTASNGRTISWYRWQNVTTGPTQISVSYGSNTSADITVFELSGVDNATPIGQTQNGTAGGFTTAPTVTANTTTDNEFGLAWLTLNVDRTVTDPSGWTPYPSYSNPTYGVKYYDDDLGTSGAKTCAPTLSTGTNAYISMVTYRAELALFNPSRAINSNQVIQ